jgi:hypothetical protein
MLLCIDEKFPDIVLVKKLERIVSDMDYIYVNLLKISKFPEYQAKYKPTKKVTMAH